MVQPSFSLGGGRGITALLLLLAAVAVAQAQGTSGRNERADPLDAQARVPAATYASALAGYRRLGDDKRIPWKDANDTVNRIGGWRAYARESQPPAPAASAAPAREPQHRH